MARFTFTSKFGATPSSTDYNSIVSDFETYINTDRLTKDNLADESIRFRHFEQNPTRLAFKDCTELLFNAHSNLYNIGRSGGWGIISDTNAAPTNGCILEYAFPEDDYGRLTVTTGKSLEYTIWYYPYSVYEHTKIAPAVYNTATGTWVMLSNHERYAGATIGYYTQWEQAPYVVNNPDKPKNAMSYYSSKPRFDQFSKDLPGTVAFGGPIICTLTFGKSGVGGVSIEDIGKFGVAIQHDTSRDVTSVGSSFVESTWNGRHESRCTRFDKLFLSLVTRNH